MSPTRAEALARDERHVREVLAGRYGDHLSTAPGEDPSEAALDMIARMSRDPAWSGHVPTHAEASAGLAALFSRWGSAADARMEQLATTLRDALPDALGGDPAGLPVVAQLRRSPLFFPRNVEVAGVEHAYLVLMHERYPHYVALIARAVMALLPPDVLSAPPSPDEAAAFVARRVQEAPGPTVESFALAAVDLAVRRDDVRERGHPVDPERVAATRFVQDATDLFVLGHECAHFEMSHRGGPVRRAHQQLGFATTDARLFHELQADELGLSISAWGLRRSRGAPLALSSIGSWMFLAALEGYELASGTAVEPVDAARHLQGYPPVALRKDLLLQTLCRSGATDPSALTHLWAVFDVALAPALDHTARLVRERTRSP